MIHGKLTVVATDGGNSGLQETVIDGNGDTVICLARAKTCDKQIFHEIDTDVLQRSGEIKARCRQQNSALRGFRAVRKDDLHSDIERCKWSNCGGAHTGGHPRAEGEEPSRQLRALLERMSVEQFDRIIAETEYGGRLYEQ